MNRPSHSAARDAAFGRYYARMGAGNALAQAIQGGMPHTNVLRIAEWRNKVARLPLEETLKDVPMGANVVLLRRAGT